MKGLQDLLSFKRLLRLSQGINSLPDCDTDEQPNGRTAELLNRKNLACQPESEKSEILKF
ncbi:hypothetical protein HC766_08840 [Candidatus Gracilibacteria bacterium]|nr:hypothetical protein [Candidatus Gracilibacteria bacterium]